MAVKENIVIDVTVDTGDATNTIDGIENRIEELIAQRNELQIGTKEFEKVSREIQGLQTDIKNVELQFESLDFEQRLTAGMDAVTGLAGGFVAAEGAMLLFNSESEQLEEVLRRVGGALALTSGLRDLANGVIAMRKFGLVTKIATARQWALNVAMNANPITIIIGALALLAAQLLIYAAATREVSEEERKAVIRKEQLGKASKKAAESIADEQVKLNSLLKVAKDRNASDKARAEAVKQLNDLSPEYLGGLTTENVLTKEGTKLVKQYNEALKKKAMAQALEEELVELYKKRIQAQKDAQAGYIEETTIWGALGDSMGLVFGDQEEALENIAEKSVKGSKKIVAGIDEQIEVTSDLLGQQQEQTLELDANTRAYDKQAEATKKAKEEKKALLKEMKKEAEGIKQIQNDKAVSINQMLGIGNEAYQKEIENIGELSDALQRESELRGENLRGIVGVQKEAAEEIKDIWFNTMMAVADDMNGLFEPLETNYINFLNKMSELQPKMSESFDAAQNQINALSALNEASLQRQIKGLEEGDKRREQIERKAFERGKKIQIAQAIISGLQGVVNIWSAASTIPQPYDAILRAVNTASLIATTAAQISKIKSTPFGGGGSVSGNTSAGASAGGGGVPINNISNTASLVDQQQQEITAQVVVLESDITTTQENVTTVSELSSF
jgi:hypothetical protein